MTSHSPGITFGEAFRQAHAAIIHSLEQRDSLIVVTGTSGTGKTTLYRSAIEGAGAASSMIGGRLLTFHHLLQQIAVDFQLGSGPSSEADLIGAIKQFIESNLVRSHPDRLAAVVIDDAHLVGPMVLGQLRALLNLSSNDQGLTIFLIGEPELEDKLRRPECQTVEQRIVHRYRLGPVTKSLASVPAVRARRIPTALRIAVAGVLLAAVGWMVSQAWRRAFPAAPAVSTVRPSSEPAAPPMPSEAQSTSSAVTQSAMPQSELAPASTKDQGGQGSQSPVEQQRTVRHVPPRTNDTHARAASLGKRHTLQVVEFLNLPKPTIPAGSDLQNQNIPASANDTNFEEGDIVTLTGWLHLVAFDSGRTSAGDYHIGLSASETNTNDCIILQTRDPESVDDPALKKASGDIRQWIRANLLRGRVPSRKGNVMEHPVHVSATGQLFFDATEDRRSGSSRACGNHQAKGAVWELNPLTALRFAGK